MTVITTIEDLRVLAKKRVPRMFYDYADSGSWTESTYRANSDDFQKIKLRQRVAVNMENRTTATTMVGCTPAKDQNRTDCTCLSIGAFWRFWGTMISRSTV